MKPEASSTGITGANQKMNSMMFMNATKPKASAKTCSSFLMFAFCDLYIEYASCEVFTLF